MSEKLILKLLRPDISFISTWLLVFIFYMMMPVGHDWKIIFKTYLVLILTLVPFVFFSNMGLRKNFNSINSIKINNIENKICCNFILLIVLSLAGSIYVIVLVASNISIINDILSFNLNQIRSDHWDSFGDSKLFLEFIISAARPFALIGGLLFGLRGSPYKNLEVFVIYVSWIGIIFDSLVSGGRFLIAAEMVMLVFVSFFSRQSPFNINNTLPRMILKVIGNRIVRIIGFFAFLYLFFILWPTIINPNLMRSFDFFFERISLGYLEISSESLLASINPDILYPLIFSGSYFSSSLASLNLYMLSTEWYETLRLGSYHLPFIGGLTNYLTGDDRSWFDVRISLGVYSGSYGYATNIWSTGIRDVIIDFGLIGLPIFMSGFGYISGKLYKRAVLQRSFFDILLLAVIFLWWILFPFISVIVVAPIRNLLILLILLRFIFMLLSRIKK